MKDINTIFADFGMSVPEGKETAFKQAFFENYVSKAEHEKVVSKRDEYKTSLDDVQTKLDGFKDINVDDLKNQITTLNTQLANEKQGREADALKAKRMTVISGFLSDKKFVNDITKQSIESGILTELEKNTGETVDVIFKKLITDENGATKEGLFAEGEDGKPYFTKGKASKEELDTEREKYKKMTLDERAAYKRKYPEKYKLMKES